jgi:hypothetical protein
MAGQAGTSITANNSYVVGDTYLFIQLKNIQSNMISTIPASFRVQLTADVGYIQFYDGSTNPQQIDCDGSTLNHLDIALIDSLGYALPLNGCEWSLLLQVQYDDTTYISFPSVY